MVDYRSPGTLTHWAWPGARSPRDPTMFTQEWGSDFVPLTSVPLSPRHHVVPASEIRTHNATARFRRLASVTAAAPVRLWGGFKMAELTTWGG